MNVEPQAYFLKQLCARISQTRLARLSFTRYALYSKHTETFCDAVSALTALEELVFEIDWRGFILDDLGSAGLTLN